MDCKKIYTCYNLTTLSREFVIDSVIKYRPPSDDLNKEILIRNFYKLPTEQN